MSYLFELLVIEGGGGIRKHFAALDKITWQLKLYDIISINNLTVENMEKYDSFILPIL